MKKLRKGVMLMPVSDTLRKAIAKLDGKPVHVYAGDGRSFTNIVGEALPVIDEEKNALFCDLTFLDTERARDVVKLIEVGRGAFSIAGSVKRREGNVIHEMTITGVNLVVKGKEDE